MDDGYDTVDATGWTGEPRQAPPRQRQYVSHKPSLKKSASASSSSSVNLEDDGPLRYKMDHPKRGLALILHNQRFDTNTLKDRHGTDTDADRMKDALIHLGFDVDVVKNVTSDEIKSSLSAKASADHSDRDCFLCVIMTHGSEDHLWGTDGRELHIKTLISSFGGQRCPSLAGKPKIFILNACQGDKLDEGQDVADAMMYQPPEEQHDESEVSVVPNLPYEMDFLYIHSTMHGYYSFRHTKEGTFFIKTLCDVMKRHGRSLEICKLLTLVNRTVALQFQSKTKRPEHDGKKQCPCYLSLLTKQLYFK